MIDDALTASIIAGAFNAHKALGSGFLEKVYENALRLELERQGLQVAQQAPIKVWYAGHIVGDYYADLWVEGKVIVELKAVLNLCKEHEIQLMNYLTAT